MICYLLATSWHIQAWISLNPLRFQRCAAEPSRRLSTVQRTERKFFLRPRFQVAISESSRAGVPWTQRKYRRIKSTWSRLNTPVRLRFQVSMAESSRPGVLWTQCRWKYLSPNRVDLESLGLTCAASVQGVRSERSSGQGFLGLGVVPWWVSPCAQDVFRHSRPFSDTNAASKKQFKIVHLLQCSWKGQPTLWSSGRHVHVPWLEDARVVEQQNNVPQGVQRGEPPARRRGGLGAARPSREVQKGAHVIESGTF